MRPEPATAARMRPVPPAVTFLCEPLAFEFFRQGPWPRCLVGALCGMIGVYIVLRRMSYIGHGLSHSVFGGAVVAYVLASTSTWAAGLWGFLSALLINATARRRKIGADAAIGIVTTASFAVGVALISKTRSFTRNFEAALFGNILGVTTIDLLVVGVVTVGGRRVHRPVLQAPPVHDVRPGGGARSTASRRGSSTPCSRSRWRRRSSRRSMSSA